MTIGERIKELRKKKDMTQEKLADFLCVSYQAVSKWECGLSSPDLSLIVPLAKLLNVTTDELLGAIPENRDVHYAKLKADYDSTFKSGDMQLRLNVCERAVKDYPADMEWINNYAWTVWCKAAGAISSESFEQGRDKAIKLFETVIENTDKDEIKANAITGIVQCLCDKGYKKEARKYVELFPDTKIFPAEKDKLLGMCLEGEDQIKHKQRFLQSCLDTLLCTLLWDGVADSKYVCSAAKEILKAMIRDENYYSYHYEMAHIHFRLAEAEAQSGNLTDAIDLLKKTVYHAKEYDLLAYTAPREYTFTSPIFNKLTYDSNDWYRSDNRTLLDDIRQMCERKCAKELRNHSDYPSLWQ